MRVYVAGINGMVGKALKEKARSLGHEVFGVGSKILDFTDRHKVFSDLKNGHFDALIISAAMVGGIRENSLFPVNFLSKNLQIQTNLLDAANFAEIEKVVFLGSSCIYPKFAKQPIKESELLTGPLEPTNEAYAIAKIAGVKLVQAYNKQFGRNWFSLMPTNMYGPHDNFNLNSSHVIPALISKIDDAVQNRSKFVTIWGDGSPLREFLHVDDFADACIFLLNQTNNVDLINVGSGFEITIFELAKLVSKTIGFEGEIVFDLKMPNGTPRKLLNSEILKEMGWSPKINLETGIKMTYKWYRENFENRRK